MAYAAPIPSSPPVASANYANSAGTASYANSAGTANSANNANYANTAGYANSSGLPSWSQETNNYVGQVINPNGYCSEVLWTNNTQSTLFYQYSTKYGSGFSFINPGQQIEFSANECAKMYFLSAYSG